MHDDPSERNPNKTNIFCKAPRLKIEASQGLYGTGFYWNSTEFLF